MQANRIHCLFLCVIDKVKKGSNRNVVLEKGAENTMNGAREQRSLKENGSRKGYVLLNLKERAENYLNIMRKAGLGYLTFT